MRHTDVLASPTTLSDALARTGYLADDGLATVAWLAQELDRQLSLNESVLRTKIVRPEAR